MHKLILKIYLGAFYHIVIVAYGQEERPTSVCKLELSEFELL